MNGRKIAWSPVDSHGFELVNVRQDERRNIMINGECLWVHNDEPYSAYYHIHLHSNWELQEISFGLRRFESSLVSPTIILARTRDGQWINHRNVPQTAFNGFTDVDISITPLTNTIPIRRLNLRVGESRDINVIYFDAPSLEPKPARQRYTCLEQYDDGSIYRFEALDYDFVADLPVDADGIVMDYPGLFRRIWTK